VPSGARACPECGADERTGWDGEKTRYDDLDLPDEAFDDGEAPGNVPSKPRVRPAGVPVLWWLLGIGSLILLVSLVFAGRLF
jgi:hypothetical protein